MIDASPGRRNRSLLRVPPLGARGDAVGLALAGAAVAWTLVAARSAGSAPPVVALIGASTLAFAVGRAASPRPWTVPAAIVLLVGLAGLMAGPGTLSRHPLTGPLGYANADAALFVQGAVAALILAFTLPRRVLRLLAVATAVAFAAVPLAKHSVAALSLLSLAGLGLAAAVVPARALVAACATLFVAALAITTLAGGAHGTDAGQRVPGTLGDGDLSDLRLSLWHEAVVIMTDHPVAGVGPGRFSAASPTARADRDARWAHHEFLQQGAEQGVPGFLLLAGLFVWAFWRLLTVAHPDRATVLGAVALAALGVHACVDYILHFPAVPLATAALLGSVTAGGRRPGGGEDAG